MPGPVNSQGPIPYVDIAMPDVCLTPVPPSPAPVPIPYPDIGLGPTAIPAQVKMLVLGMPVHNMMTQKPISNGDNVGVSLGVMSGIVMGPVSAAGFAAMGARIPLSGREAASAAEQGTGAEALSDFARFLHAKPAERQEILVNLLGLHVYQRIGEQAGLEPLDRRARRRLVTFAGRSHREHDRSGEHQGEEVSEPLHGGLEVS